MSYDLGGFSVTASTSQVMLIIFAIYSVVIVGFGFYIKYQSKKGGKDGLASFLTGGGGLGAFAIAMIAATNSMAGGTMVAAPGLGYSVGFTAALVYYAGFLTAAYGLGSVGRKVAILRDRTGAVTFQQLLGLRFQSKKVVGALAITGAFGLTFFAVGQITSGAKVFAAVTGSNSYYLGILLTIVITVIYTVSGGIKSMAKVACIQGVIMLIATFSIIGVLIANNVEQYGSVQATMEYLGTAFPGAIQADTGFSFWNAMGTALFAGVGLGAVPHALSVTMTYNSHKKLKQGVLISCCVFTLIQGIMCFTGPLTRAINPGLETADYTTIFNATNLLPSWMGGIIFCGIFAAIQSSLAGLAMAGASMLAKDFVVDCWKPNTPPQDPEHHQHRFRAGHLPGGHADRPEALYPDPVHDQLRPGGAGGGLVLPRPGGHVLEEGYGKGHVCLHGRRIRCLRHPILCFRRHPIHQRLVGLGPGRRPRVPAGLADLPGAAGGSQLCHPEGPDQAGIFPGVLLRGLR